MGKQQKLKAQRRAARQAQAKAAQEASQNPPDLGVQTAEVVNTGDRFGG